MHLSAFCSVEVLDFFFTSQQFLASSLETVKTIRKFGTLEICCLPKKVDLKISRTRKETSACR